MTCKEVHPLVVLYIDDLDNEFIAADGSSRAFAGRIRLLKGYTARW